MKVDDDTDTEKRLASRAEHIPAVSQSVFQPLNQVQCDSAAAVAFLVGKNGGWIDGQVLQANGGLI